VEGVEIKGVGSGWSQQTCQLHIIIIIIISLNFETISLTECAVCNIWKNVSGRSRSWYWTVV